MPACFVFDCSFVPSCRSLLLGDVDGAVPPLMLSHAQLDAASVRCCRPLPWHMYTSCRQSRNHNAASLVRCNHDACRQWGRTALTCSAAHSASAPRS
mmetsp:Transcript_37663/g.95186  ORF Transcript_37663/g.95186 Transcript_37663/m.95186 type:complete len:97 (+) Transcript_37663:1884-2174(+)